MQKRVVITGMGFVTPIGIGNNIFFENLFSHKTNICSIPENYNQYYNFKSKFYSPMPQIGKSELNIENSIYKIMNPAAKMAVLSAKIALDDSKLQNADLIEGAVIIGTGFANIEEAFKSHLNHLKTGPIENHFNRLIIPTLMTNSISSWISILFGIKGDTFTLNASCASGTVAIGAAFKKICYGESKIIIAGGSECLADSSGSIMRGFDCLSTLTLSSDGLPLPFSENRSGFLFCEGSACCLILEELESALKRNADIYAEIIGYETNSEAYNIVQMRESGVDIYKLIISLIKNNKIDYFNAHGTGTQLNDAVESYVIKKIFGSKAEQPVINSAKGIIGHSIGASGAIETAITAYSVKNNKIHKNIIDKPIENLNIALETIERKIDYAVNVSYGFGGHNAGLLLKKYE